MATLDEILGRVNSVYSDGTFPFVVVPRVGAASLVYKCTEDGYVLWGLEEGGEREELTPMAKQQLLRLAAEKGV
jgi:hypothetical protein